MVRRNYLFGVLREHFESFGFLPLETPAMETQQTLSGKYGEEGDQLMFHVLNNGQFMQNVPWQEAEQWDHKKWVKHLCEKALRYDLTVPFARFVAMNRHALSFPFRRYQIQPVWRADRPQAGRFREFTQCDVDAIGSSSIWVERSILELIGAVFQNLKLPVKILINHRQVLEALVRSLGLANDFVAVTVALDKLDKIGWEGVKDELIKRNIPASALPALEDWVSLASNPQTVLPALRQALANDEPGTKGLQDLDFLLETPLPPGVTLCFDLTLARGLSYYTGTIMEVKANAGDYSGSIGGGGRYDDLAGKFGVSGLSGMGFSFGADRIYSVLENMNLFPAQQPMADLMVVHFNEATRAEAHCMAQTLRPHGLRVVVLPDVSKPGKQLAYANDLAIPLALMVGDEECATRQFGLKNLLDGQQQSVPEHALAQTILNALGL
jgi:histidyl-tRNA synthetase